MDLLRRCPAGPVGRHVVGFQLNPDPRFTVDHHHVPVLLGIDGAVEHPGPEATLACEVRSVEHDDLMIDAHRVILSTLEILNSRSTHRSPVRREPSSEVVLTRGARGCDLCYDAA